ncbi:MAG: hypothetical protein JO128_17810 [Alphaproteobacteria bacterium]|nr:hypothetical protein [Alphaproteobacteria bacterium]
MVFGIGDTLMPRIADEAVGPELIQKDAVRLLFDEEHSIARARNNRQVSQAVHLMSAYRMKLNDRSQPMSAARRRWLRRRRFDQVQTALNPLQPKLDPIDAAALDGDRLFDPADAKFQLFDVIRQPVDLLVEPPQVLMDEVVGVEPRRGIAHS